MVFYTNIIGINFISHKTAQEHTRSLACAELGEGSREYSMAAALLF